MFKDYYKVLGVEKMATDEEIKEAYRKLAVELHPDNNPERDTHQLFVDINEAYQVLSDPDERRKYTNLHTAKMAPPKKNNVTSYEITRQKRRTRYARGRYSPRVRYRGSAYTGPSYEEQQKNKVAHDMFSDEFKRKIVEQHKGKVLGYTWFSRVMQVITVGLILFCGALLTDYYMAKAGPNETIISHQKVDWSFSEPGVTRIKTESSKFGLLRGIAKTLPVGFQVRVKKTPFGKIPVKVIVSESSRYYSYATYGGLYDGIHVGLIFVLLGMSIATMFTRRNIELNSYIGTITIIVAVMILGIIFKV